MMALQETKLATVDRQLCEYLWGDQEVDWVFLPSDGNSGGILPMWNSSNFSLKFFFSGKGFLGV